MLPPHRPPAKNRAELSRRRVLAAPALVLFAHRRAAAAEDAVHRHAIAMHGEPALPPNFSYLPYANPNAPKGGRLLQGGHGTFDSLNTLALRGTAPQVQVPYVVQPLMMRSLDEPFTLYGVLAESVATPADRSFVEFRLRTEAHFADGRPVTADDLLFTWSLLSTKGRPTYRAYARKIASVTALDARTVRFTFHDGSDRELAVVLGFLPVLSRHATDPEQFESMGYRSFLGSGPYRIASVEPGVAITLQRDPNFWGKDVPIFAGLFNFDEIRFEFFRDSNGFFEAFKTGLYDVRTETDPTRWLSGYDIPARADGRIAKETFRFATPKGMTGFILNTRRPVFADVRVREALGCLFDFEWVNRNLLSGLYRRTDSFYAESELSAAGLPASLAERALLAPFADAVRAEIMEGRYTPPVSDGSGRDRVLLRKAVDLLAGAGCRLVGGQMTRPDGTPLTFEILVTTREKERLALAFADSLRLVGIAPNVRYVDSSQYWRRLVGFEFDVIIEGYAVSASPGNEQANRFSSAAAEREGTLNWAGVRSPAADAMIAALLAAKTREDFITAARALDRVLMSGHYLIPLYHAPERWVARWRRIARPERMPTFDFTMDTFWQAAS